VKDLFTLFIIKGGELVGRPGDGVGFAGACAVLEQFSVFRVFPLCRFVTPLLEFNYQFADIADGGIALFLTK